MRAISQVLFASLLSLGFIAHAQYPAWKSLDHGTVTPWNLGTNSSALVATRGDSIFVAALFTNQFDRGTSWRVAKYAATGKLQWQALLTRSEDDQPQAMAVNQDGDVVVTGVAGNATSRSLLTIKFRGSDGMPVWVGPAHAQELRGRAVRFDGAGNAVVLAVSEYSPTTGRVLKYAAGDGALLWESDVASFSDIALDAAGDVLGAGDAQATPSSGYALQVGKLRGTDGTVVWTRLLSAPSYEVLPRPVIAVEAAGDLYVASNLDNAHAITHKLAGSDGQEIWKRATDPLSGRFFPLAIAAAPDGGVVVASSSARTLKYGPSGDVRWDRAYAGPAIGTGASTSAMVLDAGGNAIHAGTDWTTQSAFLLKLSAANGMTAWTSKRPYFESVALAFAGGQHPVAAVNARAGERFDLSLALYQGGTGVKSWEATPSPAPGEAAAASVAPHCCAMPPVDAAALAIDAGGSAVAAGYEHTGGGTRMRVVKRRSTDGSLLWSRGIEYGPSAVARASAMALDRTGNVIVAGTVRSSVTAFDGTWRVLKLSALDGRVLWDIPLAYGGSSLEQPHAVAVDAAGHVFVTGGGATDRGQLGIRTVKVSGADGRVLWAQTDSSNAATDGRMGVVVDSHGDAIASGDIDVAYGKTRVVKYAGADGTPLWSTLLDGATRHGGGMRVDAADNVTVATIFGSLLSLVVSRLGGKDGTHAWRYELPGVDRAAIAIDREANVYAFEGGGGGGTLHARKLAAATGTPLWTRTLWSDRVCGSTIYTTVADAIGNVHLAATVSELPSGSTCEGVARLPHVFTLQQSTGMLVADQLQDAGDELYASASQGNAVYFAGTAAPPDVVRGIRIAKFTAVAQTAALGRGTIIANPYGPLAVQGAVLGGSQITQWTPGVVIELGTTPGTPGNSARIGFDGFGIPAGSSFTVRSNAPGQSVLLEARDGTGTVILGALRAEGANGAPPPDLYIHNRNGIAIHTSGSIDSPSGLVLDALDATPHSGSRIANEGHVHGGTSLGLFGAGVGGGGLFRANAITLSTFGNANNPVHGAFFLQNGLRFAPGSGAAIAFTANLYGNAPKFFNASFEGDVTLAMPSDWPPGSTLPRNNAVVMPGETRPPNVPPPAYGGGSMIAQAKGRLTLAGSTGDFVFPGGIVLKAGSSIDFNGIMVNQGWTTSGQPFQGLFFEAPAIVDDKGLIHLYGNHLNWANFSTTPSAFVRSFTLQPDAMGGARYLPADDAAPHLNTYSLVIEAAARGECWTCLMNTQPKNMYGP